MEKPNTHRHSFVTLDFIQHNELAHFMILQVCSIIRVFYIVRRFGQWKIRTLVLINNFNVSN